MKGDYKVMVRMTKSEEWEDFSGIFFGHEFDSVIGHVKRHFDTMQFKKYQFGIFLKVSEHDYRAKECAIWSLRRIIRIR